MAVNTYECMFLLDTNKVSGDVSAAAKQIESLLQRHHAEVLASRQWDERRLAYPIKGHKKGLYYLMYFRCEGKNLINIEGDLALNEVVLRQLIIKIDPKLVDTMLALARDEHALAMPAGHEEGAEGEKPAEGAEGVRRGPRGRRTAEVEGVS